MTKEKFIQNFELLLFHLRDVTEKLCINKISENYKFILEPSERNVSSHLNTEENNYLEVWKKLKNTELSFNQVIELFYKNGKTPKWADCFIYSSKPNKTVIKIYFSRQFREEHEIYYFEIGTGPFKAVVNTNSEYIENPDVKFDVNWKLNLDKSKTKSFISRIAHFFSRRASS